MSAVWRELHALADRLQCRGVGSMEDRDEVREIANRAKDSDVARLVSRARESGVQSAVILLDGEKWTCALVGPGLGNAVWASSTKSLEAAVGKALARWLHPSRQAAS